MTIKELYKREKESMKSRYPDERLEGCKAYTIGEAIEILKGGDGKHQA